MIAEVDLVEEGSASASEASPVLHDRVVDYLREMIITGELEPGERIPERSLCSKLNVSRTPLREALKVLAAEEMVVLLPYRGAIVRKVTPAEASDILALIGALEQWGAKLACENATAADIVAVEAKHADMMNSYSAGDLEGYFKENLGFHEGIIAASHNNTLLKTYRALNNRVVKQRLMWNLKIHRWDESIRQHEKMIAALVRRDAEAVASAIEEHYAQTKGEARAPNEKSSSK